MRLKYKPGDIVIPKVHRREETADDDADRRMVEEIREMSLREVGGERGLRSYERGIRHRNRSREPRDEEGRQRRSERNGGRLTTSSRGMDSAGSMDSRSQARRIEHQSSLRSLLSTSDVDSSEMEEEILRQIVDEGLLEGIDLNNIDVSQEDALSERIADAYRRRHRQRSRSQDTRNEDSRGPRASVTPPAEERSTRRHHTRSSSGTDRITQSSHPPVSRPHLLEAYPISLGHRHRTSSESRRQTSPISTSLQVQQQATRSATDISERPRSSHHRSRRPSDQSSHARRVTGPQPRRLSDGGRRSEESHARVIPRRHVPPPMVLQNMTPHQNSIPPTEAIDNEPMNARQRHTNPPEIPVTETIRSSPPSSIVTPPQPQPELFPEPSITCERCGKGNLEYELHENCSACLDGNYNLCHPCYLKGLGCLHWFGFGHTAWQRFQREGSASQELPHSLVGRLYIRPKPESISISISEDKKRLTTENPATRLQSGAFCSLCFAFANDCFWKCDYCNEGEWGYCNRCVNAGKCCTHPLLPVAHTFSLQKSNGDARARNKQHAEASIFAPITSPRLLQAFHQSTDLLTASTQNQYRPLTFSTNCDICKYPVQPSQTRFHCYECNAGDFDICTTCYSKVIATGMISRENGDKGWRRCLQGHRMVLVGFEDSAAGQRRVIVKDLVGGHALKDEIGEAASANSGMWSWPDGSSRQTRLVSKRVSSSGAGSHEASIIPSAIPLLQRFPPDGGVGMRVVAIFSYWPQEGVADELAFPKGAEIREVEDINGDWFWGCYAGAVKLFPGSYVRVL